MGSEGSSTSPNGGAAACAVCGGAAACAVCGCTAAVYCPADAAALCAPCDAAIHAANLLSSRHQRVPLAAAAMVATSGVYDDLFAADDEGASSWPGQGSPNSSSSSFSNCSGAETSLFHLLSDVDLLAAGAAGGSLSDGVGAIHGSAAPLWLHPGLAADASTWSSPLESAVAAAAAAAANRQEKVRRYREKREKRKFQKTIRYASRKAYAEARPRIKGRFVKRPASDDDDSSATAAAEGGKFWLSFSDDSIVFDAGSYGVVPSF